MKNGQGESSNKRKNGTKPEIAGPSAKMRKGNSLNGPQKDEIDKLVNKYLFYALKI